MPIYVRTLCVFEPSIPVADSAGDIVGYRRLIVALEDGVWNLDNRPVPVSHGLVVGAQDVVYLNYFLTAGRARQLVVRSGDVLAIEAERDADYLVSMRRVERITEAEARAAFAIV